MLFCVAQDYNDDITQNQVQELAYLNGGPVPGGLARGRGRGGMGGGMELGPTGPMAFR